jgi:hypothetical protein
MRSKGLIPRFIKIIKDNELERFTCHTIHDLYNEKYRGSSTTIIQTTAILRCYKQFNHIGETKVNQKPVFVYTLEGGLA